jgi:hypothetical protein
MRVALAEGQLQPAGGGASWPEIRRRGRIYWPCTLRSWAVASVNHVPAPCSSLETTHAWATWARSATGTPLAAKTRRMRAPDAAAALLHR